MPMQLEYVQGSITVLPLTASRKGTFPTDISRAWADHRPEEEEEDLVRPSDAILKSEYFQDTDLFLEVQNSDFWFTKQANSFTE